VTTAITVIYDDDGITRQVPGVLVECTSSTIQVTTETDVILTPTPGAAAAVVVHDEPPQFLLVSPMPGEQGPTIRMMRVAKRDRSG
jgi:hypothetical protein